MHEQVESGGQMWTVRELRRRWKPKKQALHAIQPSHPLTIRIHRCCSWLACIEERRENILLDELLILQWIAINSLYGRWDPQQREPVSDTFCLRHFQEQLFCCDRDHRLAATLEQQKKLVLAILEDHHLTTFYWKEPTEASVKKSQKTVFSARTWYQQQQYPALLERVIQRVYLLRCQLIHGASTCNGRLNRTPLRRCTCMLDHLLPQMLLIMMDYGCEQDWGPLCYPPMNGMIVDGQ